MLTVGGLLLGALLVTPAPAAGPQAAASAPADLADPFATGPAAVAPLRRRHEGTAVVDPFASSGAAKKGRRIAGHVPLRDPFAAKSSGATFAQSSALRDPFAARPRASAIAPAPAPAPASSDKPLHDPFAS